ncbi:hypothetical protein WJX74_005925 [Apatococcus lobatus]|uniref:Uncharacterized protein n=1 Tax=Apatococcus lobatus TaxID=904363 RepID=A0AAW1Q9E7_9CHLO
MGKEPERRTLLVTTVDIGDGRSDKVHLREGDSPLDAAKALCRRNGLPEEVVEPLRQHIQSHLQAAQQGAEEESGEAAGIQTQQAAKQQPSGQRSRPRSAKPAGLHGPHEAKPSAEGPPAPERGHQHAAKDAEALKENAQPAQVLWNQVATEDDQLDALSVDAHPPSRSREMDQELNDLIAGAASGRRKSAEDALLYEGPELPSRPCTVPNGRLSRGTGSSVFDRLYKQAFSGTYSTKFQRDGSEAPPERTASAAKQAWAKQEPDWDSQGNSPRGSHVGAKCGDRLYVNGMLARSKRLAQAEARKAERQAAELKEVTGRPHITAMARAMRRQSSEPFTWDRLYASLANKTAEERRAAYKKAEAEQEAKQCTFHPSLDTHSSHIVAQRNKAAKENKLDHHEHLYQEALQRRERALNYAQWIPEDCTFHPQISARHSAPSDFGLSLLERMEQHEQMANTRRDAEKYKGQHPLDPDTGRPLFQPLTGRPPAANRNQAHMPVGDYLYGLREGQQDRIGLRGELVQAQFAAEASMPHANARSRTLMARLQARRFRQIYEYLAQVGEVYGQGLDLIGLVTSGGEGLLDTLDGEVKADVEAAARLLAARGMPPAQDPARQLNPMEAIPTGLDLLPAQAEAGDAPSPPEAQQLLITLEAFVGLMAEVVAAGRGIPRAYLLPSPVAKQPDQDLTFHPEISKRSKALARGRRPNGQPVHEALALEGEMTREKLQAMKSMHAENELLGCTFEPALNTKRADQGRAMLLTQMLTSHDPSTFVREWEARGLHGTITESLSQGSSPRGPLPDTGRSLGHMQQKLHDQYDLTEASKGSPQQQLPGSHRPQDESQPGRQQPQPEPQQPLADPMQQQAQQSLPTPSQHQVAGGQVDRAQQGSATRAAKHALREPAEGSGQQGSGTTRLAGTRRSELTQSGSQPDGHAWRVQAPVVSQAKQPATGAVQAGRQPGGLVAASVPGPSSATGAGRLEAGKKPQSSSVEVPGAHVAKTLGIDAHGQPKQALQQPIGGVQQSKLQPEAFRETSFKVGPAAPQAPSSQEDFRIPARAARRLDMDAAATQQQGKLGSIAARAEQWVSAANGAPLGAR